MPFPERPLDTPPHSPIASKIRTNQVLPANQDMRGGLNDAKDLVLTPSPSLTTTGEAYFDPSLSPDSKDESIALSEAKKQNEVQNGTSTCEYPPSRYIHTLTRNKAHDSTASLPLAPSTDATPPGTGPVISGTLPLRAAERKRKYGAEEGGERCGKKGKKREEDAEEERTNEALCLDWVDGVYLPGDRLRGVKMDDTVQMMELRWVWKSERGGRGGDEEIFRPYV